MAVSRKTTTARKIRAAIILNRQPRVARRPSSSSLSKTTKISDHRPLNLNKINLQRKKRKRQRSKSKEEVANRHQSKIRERANSLSPKDPRLQNQPNKRRRKKLLLLKMPGVL